MQDAIRVFAGECTVTHHADRRSEKRGEVLVLIKPDNTVLVHDATGYRPAGWLTRADSVRVSQTDAELELTATKDEEWLSVESTNAEFVEFPVTRAGPSVGTCPDCGGTMVRASGSVTCLSCGDSYRLPRDATVTDETCADCGLPTISVARGADLEVCLDRECSSIDDAVSARFDGEWSCRECGSPMIVSRERTLHVDCPDCEASYPLPNGTVSGTCECGLPWFDTARGGRCLDAECEAGTQPAEPSVPDGTTGPQRERSDAG